MIAVMIGWLALAGGAFPVAASSVPDNAARPETPAEAPPMTDIHDIKPPEQPPATPDLRLYALAGALILALLGLWFWTRRRTTHRKAAAPPPVPPAQLALQDLAALRDGELVDGRAFYFRLSAILREYLQGRFGINAPEMTVEELLPRIKGMDLPVDLKGRLQALLRSAEPVKFAGAAAVARQMAADRDFAVAFVRETAPEGAPAPDEGNGEGGPTVYP